MTPNEILLVHIFLVIGNYIVMMQFSKTVLKKVNELLDKRLNEEDDEPEVPDKRILSISERPLLISNNIVILGPKKMLLNLDHIPDDSMRIWMLSKNGKEELKIDLGDGQSIIQIAP